MWFRLRLDIGAGGLLRAAWESLLPASRRRAEARLNELWPGEPFSASFLSVRSGLDLLLQALELPRGSQVLMSALTIGDMIEVVRAHGLEPVPLDLDPGTGRVDEHALSIALGPRTKLVVVAQLFGDVAPLDGVRRACDAQEVLLVEDCAQAYSGLNGYAGAAEADVSMFSFGPIKTATALGGAIFRLRDGELRERMLALQAAWPIQSRRSFLRRVLVYGALSMATSRACYSGLERLARSRGRDIDELLIRASKSFGSRGLLSKIRQQSSTPLLRFLRWRLATYDESSLRDRQRNGRWLAERLRLPLARSEPDHAFWLFPLRSDRPAELKRVLRQGGFDSSEGHSLVVVPDHPAGSHRAARRLLEQLLFVPVYGALPPSELERMAALIEGQAIQGLPDLEFEAAHAVD